jgi:UDP-N-acetylglucosamine 2-epimerase (non-hydrolysing)
MTNKFKLMTIVGTRPELIRLSEIIKKADVFFNHVFVHTGQNYDTDLNDVFYDDLDLRKPDFYLDAVGNNLGRTIGNVIAKSYEILQKEKPDALLILGDTNSALCAISAKRLKVPVFHMEAGNRCFDENVPEEINRRMIDHISDINLPYTEHARRNLLNEGLQSRFVFVTGSPLREVINANRIKIEASPVLERLNVEKGKYMVVSAHREENMDNASIFEIVMASIKALAANYKLPVIYSVHPRSAKFIKERGIEFDSPVRPVPPFNFSDYTKLMKNAFCVVSDSGTLAEESTINNFPAVSMRTSTERPEAIDKGVFVPGNVHPEDVLDAVNMAVGLRDKRNEPFDVSDYASADVSETVIKIIRSHTPVVNELIWRKKP